jgi:hypothetical protein
MKIEEVDEILKQYRQTLISRDPASQLTAIHRTPELVKEIKRLRKAMMLCLAVIIGTDEGKILQKALEG